jgi:p-aminobenzoyl-glutamate transporter AbgT
MTQCTQDVLDPIQEAVFGRQASVSQCMLAVCKSILYMVIQSYFVSCHGSAANLQSQSSHAGVVTVILSMMLHRCVRHSLDGLAASIAGVNGAAAIQAGFAHSGLVDAAAQLHINTDPGPAGLRGQPTSS